MGRQRRFISGFTLIELMIVVSIIGILAAIALPKFADLVRKSKEGATKGNLGTLRSAVNIYYNDMEGIFPSVGAVGFALNSLTINGKYLTAIPAARTPDYHTDTSTEADFGPFGGGCFMLGTASNDTGGWAYFGCTGDLNFGMLLVNCTHTDSKSTVWTIY